jgi:hypothetical protein
MLFSNGTESDMVAPLSSLGGRHGLPRALAVLGVRNLPVRRLPAGAAQRLGVTLLVGAQIDWRLEVPARRRHETRLTIVMNTRTALLATPSTRRDRPDTRPARPDYSTGLKRAATSSENHRLLRNRRS